MQVASYLLYSEKFRCERWHLYQVLKCKKILGLATIIGNIFAKFLYILVLEFNLIMQGIFLFYLVLMKDLMYCFYLLHYQFPSFELICSKLPKILSFPHYNVSMNIRYRKFRSGQTPYR